MAEKIDILLDNNIMLSAELYRPDDPVINNETDLITIMVHGFPGSRKSHENLFQKIGLQLKENGYASVSYDSRGCGESDGTFESYNINTARRDLVAIVNNMRTRGYSRFVFIGEGLGNIVSFLDYYADAECFIMLWPVIDTAHYAKNVFNSVEAMEKKKHGDFIVHNNERISTKFILELEHSTFTSYLQKITAPVLVMHGTDDKIVPIEGLDIIRNYIGSGRVEITSFQGAGHGLLADNHRNAMLYHIGQFIKKYAKNSKKIIA